MYVRICPVPVVSQTRDGHPGPGISSLPAHMSASPVDAPRLHFDSSTCFFLVRRDSFPAVYHGTEVALRYHFTAVPVVRTLFCQPYGGLGLMGLTALPGYAVSMVAPQSLPHMWDSAAPEFRNGLRSRRTLRLIDLGKNSSGARFADCEARF
jgi:hypothetical protein